VREVIATSDRVDDARSVQAVNEGHNNKIRTMTRRAYGFDSLEAAPVL